jgi:UDP-N-acetylglucosamine 2-epimerase (non-hydrolysing)/GDP/UDP-N,N'-diacetylbacillosamine 2-epimerase (hydrolysing)
MRTICAITSSRADYGLLYWVLKAIESDPNMDLRLVVTGSHLSAAHGMTIDEILRDGFVVAERVTIEPGEDRIDASHSLGRAVSGLADAIDRQQPEVVVLLGDRYEILGAAAAAMLLGIPIAHIAGGDVTEGAFDDAIRHSITKMSHIHFVTNADSARRVRQMGEDPTRIHIVGSPGLDTIRRISLMTREELSRDLGFVWKQRNLLITFHPSTVDVASANEQLAELFAALGDLGSDVGLIFTKGNIDPGAAQISEQIDHFVAAHANARAYTSLGQKRYLSVIAGVDAVVGNSSSGLYEVPSFRKPTVDIGTRQKGRLYASSVIHAPAERRAIGEAISSAFMLDCSSAVNPYGDGYSAERIHRILSEEPGGPELLRKRFHECA